MSTEIVPYTAEWEPAVQAFNQRLLDQQGPITFQFPERHRDELPPPGAGNRVCGERFLAVEDRSVVRGGYLLKIQDFWIDGREQTIANLGLPLSEGIVNPRYRFLGVQLVRDAVRRWPSMFTLGMGGMENPLPRMLGGLGWTMFLVPFRFRFLRPSRCLREIPRLRRSPAQRLASDALALTGAGWAAARVAQALIAWRGPHARECQVESVAHFEDWTDEVWDAARGDYLFSAVRDRAAMEALYGGPSAPNLHILKMTRHGRPIGWALVGDSVVVGHRHFGDLRLGSLIDGFARTVDVPAVVVAATRFLERRGVDLIVSNQCQRAWLAGLQSAGFMRGPSNFALGLTSDLAARVAPWETTHVDYHFNRGDGDGPINL
jgi:hypothetical protein